jgi:AcrR family transcriptional regulator
VKSTNRSVKKGGVSSRDRIFRAACVEFARRGFAGGSVDRIAAAARVNKAMLYYHFGSKAGLYREILRDMFEGVAARLDETVPTERDVDGRIRAFVAAIAHEAEARPHFPPIWFREVAEEGTHLDPATLAAMAAIVGRLGEIVRDGTAAGRYRPVHPLLVHAGIVAPLLLYYASAGLRRRIAKAGVSGADRMDSSEVVAHVQRVALTTLKGRK